VLFITRNPIKWGRTITGVPLKKVGKPWSTPQQCQNNTRTIEKQRKTIHKQRQTMKNNKKQRQTIENNAQTTKNNATI
jgi:DNA-binding transcriptional MerR regulator